jgi:nitrogenase molybdenum-iron protein alpha/beta subunit
MAKDTTPILALMDLDEVERILGEVGIRIHAVIAGGCTVEELRRAREVELNASWCYDWGQKLGDLFHERVIAATQVPAGYTVEKADTDGGSAPRSRSRSGW